MRIDRSMDFVIIDPLDTGIMSLMYASEALTDKDPRAGRVKP